mmetsp:Transcript_87747/g.248530  ORF Transcript_87747/g.248530 Transcript_87747/m.248530 type:complete len:209 (-) Transcript_87747:1232-1858(-)
MPFGMRKGSSRSGAGGRQAQEEDNDLALASEAPSASRCPPKARCLGPFCPQREKETSSCSEHHVVIVILIVDFGILQLLPLTPLLCVLGVLTALLRIRHRFHRLVTHLEAECDALVKSLLRLARSVDLLSLPRLHESPFVIDGRIDDPVHDSLGHDTGGILRRLQAHALAPPAGQLRADVLQRDAAVRRADAPQARLDDVVAEAVDQS